MTTKMTKLIIIGGILLVLLIISGMVISTVNRESELRNKYTAKMNERVAFYDKMWKKISQVAKVSVRVDSSFQRIVNIQMNGQKDGEQVTWKWIQQSNPSASFKEVSDMYKQLSTIIESEREGFFNQEKVLQDIKLQDDNILKSIPSGTILRHIFGRTYLVYKPITSDRTDNVFKTGHDNNVDVF